MNLLPMPSTLAALRSFCLLFAALAGTMAQADDTAPAVAPAASASAPAEADPEADARFDILEYVIEGNTVLPVAEIERAVTPFLGERKLIADVEAARKALEAVYQELGYQTVLVDVPEQRVTGGVIRLRVLEGRVERLRITGNRYFTQGEIRTRVPDLAAGTVPDLNAVQAQLGTLNRGADRQVTPVLRPGLAPGGVEVELIVKDQLPLHGDLELNNRSSAFTSATRLAGGLRWDNLWQRQHSAGVSVQLSPQQTDEVRVLVGNYLWRMPDRPDVVALYAVRSNSRVALVGSSTIIGKASIAGARWVKPLPSGVASAGLFQSLTFGADYKNFAQTDIAVGFENEPVQGSIAYVPLSLAYSATLAEAGRSTQYTVTAAAAPAGVLGNNDSEFQGRRVLARAGWTTFKLDATHERALTPRVGLWARLEGQWTADPLISNEQYAIGGAESVRGYRESELAGDRGGRTSVELRWWPWRVSPEELRQRALDAAQAVGTTAGPATMPGTPITAAGAATPADRWTALQFYGLFDLGAVEIVQPLGPQFARRWIGGLGAGLRWNSAQGWRLQFEGARALNPGGGSLNGPITDTGQWRWHARLGFEF
jgi:hemolysin activation/secretion protein